MTEINYTASNDCRANPVKLPANAVRIELQGHPENVAALATLLRQQTEVLEDSQDNQTAGVNEVRQCLVVKEISSN